MFQTINNPSPLSAAPLKKKRGRPRKIKVEEEDESFAEPLVTFKVRIQKELISDLMRNNEEIRGKRLGQL
jgi:hypothetical protein